MWSLLGTLQTYKTTRVHGTEKFVFGYERVLTGIGLLKLLPVFFWPQRGEWSAHRFSRETNYMSIYDAAV